MLSGSRGNGPWELNLIHLAGNLPQSGADAGSWEPVLCQHSHLTVTVCESSCRGRHHLRDQARAPSSRCQRQAAFPLLTHPPGARRWLGSRNPDDGWHTQWVPSRSSQKVTAAQFHPGRDPPRQILQGEKSKIKKISSFESAPSSPDSDPFLQTAYRGGRMLWISSPASILRTAL